MTTFQENLNRVSIMPFLWSILSLGANKYSLLTTAICIVVILAVVIGSYIYIKSLWKRKHIHGILSNVEYIGYLFISNILFVILSIGVFHESIMFIILLAVSCILNIGFIWTSLKLRRHNHE